MCGYLSYDAIHVFRYPSLNTWIHTALRSVLPEHRNPQGIHVFRDTLGITMLRDNLDYDAQGYP
jgi:hypothetical protein